MVLDTKRTVTRPFTGDEYLESLRDGREIWIYGERVKDVTTHPAFRNSARMIARLYDALHDPAQKAVLTTETDTGSGGFTHPFFKAPRTSEELVASRDAIAAWQRIGFGWMGRTPDYKASFMATLGGIADFYEPYQENARRWYRISQEQMPFMNHAIVHPPVDRNRPPDEVADVYVHVEKETDAGLVVSGAKVVATGSALTHLNFIAHRGIPLKKKEFALVFLADMDSPGVKLICRPSYELQASVIGSPFDYPLSSRMDENDAIMVFDHVLVPWENVFIYGDLERANSFYHHSGFLGRFTFQAITRLAVKLDFILGLLLKAVEIAGTGEFRGVQAQIGEVIVWRNICWALTDAQIQAATPWGNGYLLPNQEYGATVRVYGPEIYAKIKHIIYQVVASGLIYQNSHVQDWSVDELRPYLDKYLRGSNGIEAIDRIKVMRLLWDAVGTEFGGRHELYEMNYAGSHEDTRLAALMGAAQNGRIDEFKAFAERCMAEYDVNGWTAPDLINPDDVNFFAGGKGIQGH
ncbi:MAG TPA: 4-hydroxyphenylacetate 3-hydroxylase N-terminal domain-containing protein [Chloroflexota bacterium]|nr:4-hydroxyphenylacetate 3-hydroxylase N-terminal domain-containing protein [Chloroflexota bacterium]